MCIYIGHSLRLRIMLGLYIQIFTYDAINTLSQLVYLHTINTYKL